MKILWSSTNPFCTTGYGNVTKEAIKRLRGMGHYVRVATKHPNTGWQYWQDKQAISKQINDIREKGLQSSTQLDCLENEIKGTEICEGINVSHINKMLEVEKFDYIFTLWDIWLLESKTKFTKDKWIAYVPIDTEQISDALKRVVKETGIQIAMSQHGVRELRSMGLEPLYAPLGINTKLFRPKPEGRQAFRKSLELTDDNLLIGSVGLNYGDDRKGFIPLMIAFKEFHNTHPEARLYIHSHARGADEIDYTQVGESLGIEDLLIWPDQMAYNLNIVSEEQLASIYSAMDVFCLPSKGEGFGMPIIESQSCGVPVIVPDTTSGAELCKTGWLIETDKLDDKRWLPTGTWRLECRVSEILKCMELAYNAWKYSDYNKLRELARESVACYDWDIVWGKYFMPIFELLEGRLNDGRS